MDQEIHLVPASHRAYKPNSRIHLRFVQPGSEEKHPMSEEADDSWSPSDQVPDMQRTSKAATSAEAAPWRSASDSC